MPKPTARKGRPARAGSTDEPTARGAQPVAAAGEAEVGTAHAGSVLFCPFCRESYENQARCPDHELVLVPWDELNATETEILDEERPVSPVDLRFGRGELFAGVLLLLVAVLSPVFSVSEGDHARTFTLLDAATDRAPNLWTVPFVAVVVLSITLRRRTIREMLGARLAMLVLATGPFVSLAYTLYKVYGGAAQLSAALHRDVVVHLGWGIALVLAGGVLLAIGALRLGVAPQQARKGRAGADPNLTDPWES